jgi:hypothetical protein
MLLKKNITFYSGNGLLFLTLTAWQTKLNVHPKKEMNLDTHKNINEVENPYPCNIC